MTTLASLIIPTYNVEEFVGETLESVRAQTLAPKFEVVIVDDGSRDNTCEIIEREISNMDNVGFYRKSVNEGSAVARNQAIDYSEGKYILILDGDDILEPNAVESTLDFMLNNPHVQYSYSMHKRINTQGNHICDRPCHPFSRKRLFHFNYVGPIKCFTRETHEKIKGFDPEILYAMDWDHILRASKLLDENQIAQNPEYLYRYRIHEESISNSKHEERKRFIERFLAKHLAETGIEARVFWDYKEDGYNYFNWEEKEVIIK